jgi:hypothetical protein
MNRKYRRAFDRSVSNAIQKGTREVMRVFDNDGIGFAYTIGNSARGLPELLFIGSCSPGIGGTLQELSDKLIERGCAFSDGEEISLGGRFPVKIVNADERAQRDYTYAATGRFGAGNYSVQQVLPPDLSGRFPGDPECSAPYRNIPVLNGPASVH